MTDIVLDVPLPPSVNKIRRINWATYGDYKRWQADADKTLMLHKQNKQHAIVGPYVIIITVDYDRFQGDLDNILKGIVDYCVTRKFVSDDRKKFMRGVAIRFEEGLPEPCRITIASGVPEKS
jgi:Holliday junction resolvase RusA-like endonuclease